MIDLERYQVNSETDCWEWQGALSHDGYARNSIGYVHRQTFTRDKGPIPSGLQLDHLCRVRHCINPDHLEVVTGYENMRRGDVWKIHGLKTHCPSGHEYNEQNTRVYNGRRHCRVCDRLRNIKRRQKVAS